ncbi:MAG: hypothetical protein AB4050_14040 [Synechococcus sp.]
MATQSNVFSRLTNSLVSVFKGAMRAFETEHDDYPKTGTRPLKHKTYKEGKDRHKH